MIATQYDLQQELNTNAKMNLVTCGNCGSTLIHRTDQVVIVCPDCGFMSEPCDFPDLNVINEKTDSPLYEHAKTHELILDEVFLSDDKNETDPVQVYCDTFERNTDFDDPRIIREEKELILCYAVSEKTKKVRVWGLTDFKDKIIEQHREEILKSRLSKFTDADKVSLADIFMHGGYILELTMDGWYNAVKQHWNL